MKIRNMDIINLLIKKQIPKYVPVYELMKMSEETEANYTALMKILNFYDIGISDVIKYKKERQESALNLVS